MEINVEPLISIDETTGAVTMYFPVIKTDGSIKIEPRAINLSKEDIEQKIKIAQSVVEETK